VSPEYETCFVTSFWPLGFEVASRFLENLCIPEVMQLLNDIMQTK